MKPSQTALFRLLAPLLGVFLVSCGSDEPEDPLKSASGFCGEWGKSVCTDAIILDCASGSVEKCQQAQRDYCLDRVSENLYTGEGATECLDFLSNAYRDRALDREERDALVRLGAPCDKLLSGSGKAGKDCNQNKDCSTIDGLECVKQYGETRGQCQKPRLVPGGGRCSNADSVCQEGQYCNGSNCVAKSEEGEICSETVPCDESTRCVIEEEETEGECTERKDNGERCKVDEECISNLCDRNASESEGYCVEALRLTVRVDMCDSFH